MQAFCKPQQRKHRVVRRGQVPPQIKQPVPARRYFPQDLLGREASKKLVCPFDLPLPYLQAESYVCAFVSHGFISLRPLSLICTLGKSFRTWEYHSSIALLWLRLVSRPNARQGFRFAGGQYLRQSNSREHRNR